MEIWVLWLVLGAAVLMVIGQLANRLTKRSLKSNSLVIKIEVATRNKCRAVSTTGVARHVNGGISQLLGTLNKVANKKRRESVSMMLGKEEVITHGLVIDRPWIGKILRGEKIWEMRGTNVKRRGPFALIQKGTGTVIGVARLVDVQGPFTPDQLQLHESKHCVQSDLYRQPDYKWNRAWVLADIAALESPVSYRHKNGAVTWVALDVDAQQAIASQLRHVLPASPLPEQASPLPEQASPYTVAKPASMVQVKAQTFGFEALMSTTAPSSSIGKIPVARDGTRFCPILCDRNGCYTVGDKGDEQRFTNYQAALDFLRAMPKAKWRRPNAAGNWGIVTVVDWVSV